MFDPYMLISCFFKFSEMTYQLMEVYFMLYAESVPQITAYHDTSKAHILSLLNIFKTHTPQGIDMLVDKSLVACKFHFLNAERSLAIAM